MNTVTIPLDHRDRHVILGLLKELGQVSLSGLVAAAVESLLKGEPVNPPLTHHPLRLQKTMAFSNVTSVYLDEDTRGRLKGLVKKYPSERPRNLVVMALAWYLHKKYGVSIMRMPVFHLTPTIKRALRDYRPERNGRRRQDSEAYQLAHFVADAIKASSEVELQRNDALHRILYVLPILTDEPSDKGQECVVYLHRPGIALFGGAVKKAFGKSFPSDVDYGDFLEGLLQTHAARITGGRNKRKVKATA